MKVYVNTIVFLGILLGIMTHGALAEKIFLKSGDVVEGQIVEETGEYIKVKMLEDMTVKYYFDEIERIEKPSSARVSAQEESLEVNPEDSANIPPSPTAEPLGVDPMEEEIQAIQKEKKEAQQAVDSTQETMSQTGQQWLSNTQNQLLSQEASQKTMPLGEDYLIYQLKMILPRYGQQIQDLEERLREYVSLLKEKLSAVPPLWLYCTLGIIYVLISIPLMLMARKMDLDYLWLSWVPIVQIFLIIPMADRSWRCIFYLFIPVINIFIFLDLFFRITKFLNLSSLWGFFMLLPGINILVLWYLALCPNQVIWQETKHLGTDHKVLDLTAQSLKERYSRKSKSKSKTKSY